MPGNKGHMALLGYLHTKIPRVNAVSVGQGVNTW